MNFDTIETIIMAIFIALLLLSTCIILCERYLPNLSLYDRTLLSSDEANHIEFIVESPSADYNSVLSGSIFSPAEIYGTLIIPTENNQDTIKDVLSNAMKVIQEMQDSYPDHQWEIIVVDNFSEDETPNIVAEYACNHTIITLIKVLEPLGIGGCVQLGSFNAKGKFIFAIPPNYRMSLLQKLEKSINMPNSTPFVFSGSSFAATREAVGLFMTNLHIANQAYIFELKRLLRNNYIDEPDTWNNANSESAFRDSVRNINSIIIILICYFSEIWQIKQKGTLSTYQEA